MPKWWRENYFYKLLIPVVIIMLTGIRGYGQSGDIYNFYFQKAPGPQTVIQGTPHSKDQSSEPTRQEERSSAESNSVAIQKATESNVNKADQKVDSKEIETEPLKRWEILLGMGYIDEAIISYDVIAIGLKYRFTDILGADLGLLLPDTEVKRYREGDSYSFNYDEASKHSLEQNSDLRFSLGGVLTPIKGDFFGSNFFNLHLLAGIFQSSNQGEEKLEFYGGVGIDLNFGSTFSASVRWKTGYPNSNSEMTYGGLTIKI